MALSGLTELYGHASDGLEGAGALASQGTTADPSHAIWGDAAGPPWATGPYPSDGQTPYGPDWLLVGEPPPVAGLETTPADRTPISPAAPYPRLSPADSQLRDGAAQWDAQAASALLHGADLGGPARITGDPAGHATPTHWDVHDPASPGATLLPPVPAQIRGAGTGTDEAQGYGVPNRFGFADGHLQYRAQSDPVPGNYQWLEPGERPFIIPRPAVQATFDGPDSPYGALGDTTGQMWQGTAGAAVESFPTAYAAPPDPTMLPAAHQAAEAPSIGSWF